MATLPAVYSTRRCEQIPHFISCGPGAVASQHTQYITMSVPVVDNPARGGGNTDRRSIPFCLQTTSKRPLLPELTTTATSTPTTTIFEMYYM